MKNNYKNIMDLATLSNLISYCKRSDQISYNLEIKCNEIEIYFNPIVSLTSIVVW